MVCNASSKAYDQALSLLRYAGTLVCVGIPKLDPHPISEALPWKMVVNQLITRGDIFLCSLHVLPLTIG